MVKMEPNARPAHERTYLASIALLALATFFVSLLWLFTLPYFEGPDEQNHYNSVARLTDGGGWPKPYTAPLLGSTLQALGEAGWDLPIDEPFDQLAPPADRAGFLGPTDVSDGGRDQMVQHPPGYYAVGATVITVIGADGMRWDHASLLLGALSAALSAGAIPFIAGAVRRATDSRWAGVLGAIFPLLIPSYTALASRISNDALLVLAVSAATYALVRALVDAHRRTWMLILAGIAYGIALGTKGYALIFLPVVIILATVAAWRAKRRVWPTVWRLLVPAGIAFGIGGWWWVRNIITLGKVQPSQFGSRERQTSGVDDYSFGTFVETFFPRLNSTFWDRAGYVYEGSQGGIVAAAGIALILLLVIALIFTRSRIILAILLVYPAAITAILFSNAHGIYWDTGDPTRGTQGRYLYSGIAAFALAFAAVADRLLGSFSGRVRALATVVAGSVASVAIIWSMCLRIPITWQSREALTPASVGNPTDFMDVPSIVYWATAVAACALLLGGLFVGAQVAWRDGRQRPMGTQQNPVSNP